VIGRLLEGAENVITRAQHCWLMTISQRGRVNARPMGRIVPSPGQTDWTLCFLSDARSKKVLDIRSATDVRLTFYREDDAFVSLAGPAEVVADAATIERRWQADYDRIFPTAADKTNAVFIDIRADELRLWIRGLTPEPFGVRSMMLRRPLGGDWHLDSERP
jgi:general stress protein 26